jgi:hypothetical protein
MSYEAWSDNDDNIGIFDAAIEAGWIDPLDQSEALIDVMNERNRQHNEEGWTPEHDDAHTFGELAHAAACYAMPIFVRPEEMPIGWPTDWDEDWWKPTDRRRDLVKAAALILAEIERLDRIGAPK